jgi:ABC-type branched-subunit amino acid transport system substrate-binding protein
MNLKQVPMLFVATGGARFTDPKNYPWTIGYNPNYVTEGHVYGQFILKEHPNSKVAVLYQNDDLGRDYVKGLKETLGPAASSMIVAEASYEITDPTVDSQILKLRASGADLLYDITTPKFAAQTIKKLAELGWSPVHILDVNAVSVAEVLKPAGLENSKGIISVIYGKDPSDPTWKDDPGMKKYFEMMDKYYSEGNRESLYNSYGFGAAELLVHVLRKCGDDLTRENIMKQAANIQSFTGSLSLPGTAINTSPDDYRVIKQFQMVRFDGVRWQPFGPIVTDEAKM